MVVLQTGPKNTAVENNSVKTIEHKAKVIKPKVNRGQPTQKPKKKAFDFDYIAAGTAACVGGVAMILRLGLKRA